jgi:leucyl aminopeptidase (aminopeptidase T)
MTDDSNGIGTQLARTVLDKTLQVRPGENVIVETWSEALPWARPFIVHARRKGAHAMMLYEDEPAFWESLDAGASRATGQVGSHEWAALAKTSAYVFFFGPSEWPRFDELPDQKTRGVDEYNPEWYRRAARAKVRGARMYLGRTSPKAAERWKVDLEAWRSELIRASLVPPSELHRSGMRIAKRLQQGRSVEITHPNGTRLTFRLGRFPIRLDDAMVDEADLRAGNNLAVIPGGVVGVAIDHTSAEGTLEANRDVYPDSGPVSGGFAGPFATAT